MIWLGEHFLLALILVAPFAAGCSTLPYPKSDHFDGDRFHNPEINVDKGLWDVLIWRLTGDRAEWPEWREIEKFPVPQKPMRDQATTTFINHATHLIQLSEVHFLTDPIFSERASPFTWVGPKRIHKPGIELEALPKIHYVVISHNHYDHMDVDSIRKLTERFNPVFIVPLGNQRLIESMGGKRVIELSWWQSVEVEGTDHTVTLVPVQHWSARGLFDRNKALWGGFVIRNPHLTIFFAGDTGYNTIFSKIKERFGKIDLSILPIGAYEPRWFMKEQHLNPEEAVQAHIDLESKFSIGTHFGTYQLTDESVDAPVNDLKDALRKKSISPTKFVSPKPGESHLIIP